MPNITEQELIACTSSDTTSPLRHRERQERSDGWSGSCVSWSSVRGVLQTGRGQGWCISGPLYTTAATRRQMVIASCITQIGAKPKVLFQGVIREKHGEHLFAGHSKHPNPGSSFTIIFRHINFYLFCLCTVHSHAIAVDVNLCENVSKA